MLPLVETALQISLDAGVLLEDTVVVIGAGAIGLLTAVLLRRGGAHVLVVEPRPWRRALVEALGAGAAMPDDAPAFLAAAGHPDGVGLVIEASGSPAALPGALDLLAHEGTLLVASWYGSQPAVLPLGGRFHRRRLTIRSTQVSTIPAHLSSRWDRRRRLNTAARLLSTLPLDRLATHTFPFEEAAAAYQAIDEGVPGLMHAALGYG
jgi:threonine dehydrogenase-like Zn-dependent dehydrogenase